MTTDVITLYQRPAAALGPVYTLMKATYVTTGGLVVRQEYEPLEVPVASGFGPERATLARRALVNGLQALGYSYRKISDNVCQLWRFEGQTDEGEDVYIYVRLKLIVA